MKQQPWWFIFYKDQLLLEKTGKHEFAIPRGGCPPLCQEPSTIHTITTLEGSDCRAFALPTEPVGMPTQYTLMGLRPSYDHLPLPHYQVAGKAYEILHWDSSNRFCATCGTPLVQKEPIMKQCPACRLEVYPTISTAILVLVRKEESILLVHAHNFKRPFYSLIAGFLETGETLEECVAREVKEETGLEVRNITYFGNQPWPYPSGLMVGFVADYAGGELQLQQEELSSGGFYTKENLPELPQKLSLARKIIDWWIEQQSTSR